MSSQSARRRRPWRALTVAAIGVAAALLAGGCAHGSAPAGATGSAQASPRDCPAGYCAPADWDTATASTPLAQIPPFAEPLNVVISAKSTVSLADLQRSMTGWTTVSTATTVSVTGIHLKCISAESADVTGHGYQPQQAAWRLGGCVRGNELSLSGDEDHVRIWNQPVAGSADGAWFIAASFETMCLVRDGTLQTARANKAYAALHPGSAYHCVDGGPGSIATAHPNGYADGAKAFSTAVIAAATSHGWQVSRRTMTVARGARSGEGGVPFSGTVYLLTVTR